MSTQSNSRTNGGIGTTGLLGVAFIVLKLTGVINWSWWWVLAPLWMPVGIVFILAIPIFLVKAYFTNKKKRRSRKMAREVSLKLAKHLEEFKKQR